MQFGPDDITEFAATKRTLLDEFQPWADEHYGADDGSLVADADTFLSWRFNYSTGDLADLDIADADEFLLDWAPRKSRSAQTRRRPYAAPCRRWSSSSRPPVA